MLTSQITTEPPAPAAFQYECCKFFQQPKLQIFSLNAPSSGQMVTASPLRGAAFCFVDLDCQRNWISEFH